MGPSILAATIAAAASAMLGIDLSGDGVVAKTGHGSETRSLNRLHINYSFVPIANKCISAP